MRKKSKFIFNTFKRCARGHERRRRGLHTCAGLLISPPCLCFSGSSQFKRNFIMRALCAHTHMRASPCEEGIIKAAIFIIFKGVHSPNRRHQQLKRWGGRGGGRRALWVNTGGRVVMTLDLEPSRCAIKQQKNRTGWMRRFISSR